MELPGTETTNRRFLTYGVPILVIAILLVIAAIVLDLGPFSDDALSEEELIAQGDQICADARDLYDEAQQTPPGTTQEAADRMQRLLDISQQEQDALRELAAPDELEEPLEAYLEAREEAFQHLRDAETSIRDGDERGYAQADQELEEGEGERARLAAAVGFEVCSRRGAG